MRPEQIARLESLRDRLVERSLTDADPLNWSAGTKLPKDMDREERGNAKWDRALAIQTITLTMQVQRLLANPAVGGAIVPDTPDKQPEDSTDTVEASVARYEEAAAQVLAARTLQKAKGEKHPKR